MSEKRYIVSITRGSRKEDRAAPYKNVHKIEAQGSWIVMKKNKKTTIYFSAMDVETIRVDEMKPDEINPY